MLKKRIAFYLDHYLGNYSTQRRLQAMLLTQINQKIHRIDLRSKKILIIVAHCDDEVIWANTVLTSTEPIWKDLLVIHDGGQSRNKIIKKIAKDSGAKLKHLKIKENIHPKENALAFIPQKDVVKIKLALQRIFKTCHYDYIFTHNEFGEYGHGQHRQVHQIVKELASGIKNKSKLVFFGYAYPLIFDKGITFWPETLKVFATNRKWTKNSQFSVRPFRGIFRFKKYPDYFYHDTNCYLPQKNTGLMLKLSQAYSKAKDAWIGWLKPSSAYYKYLFNNIQYFFDPKLFGKEYIEYEWSSFGLTPWVPKTSKNSKPPRSDDVRAFLDDYLLDYLHFERDVLWIGWNEFCMKNNYRQRLLKYADKLDLLDKEKSRLDKKIYREQTANVIGDLCNLKKIVKSETYDSIICNGVLEYVDSIPKAISESARILKSRGRILFGVSGYDWDATGKNRSHFEYIIKLLYKNKLLPVEVWKRINPDYYYIHAYKQNNRLI